MTAPPDIDARLDAALPPERLEAARAAYHDARSSGLCHDGAWEVALGTPEAPLDRPADALSETSP